MANNLLFIVLVVAGVLLLSGGLTGGAIRTPVLKYRYYGDTSVAPTYPTTAPTSGTSSSYGVDIAPTTQLRQTTPLTPTTSISQLEQSQDTKIASLQQQYSSLSGIAYEALQEGVRSNVRLNILQGLAADAERGEGSGKRNGCECTCLAPEGRPDPIRGNAWGTVICAVEGNKCAMGYDQQCQPPCQAYCAQSGGSLVGQGKCTESC